MLHSVCSAGFHLHVWTKSTCGLCSLATLGSWLNLIFITSRMPFKQHFSFESYSSTLTTPVLLLDPALMLHAERYKYVHRFTSLIRNHPQLPPLIEQTNLSLQPECSHNLPLYYMFFDKYDAVMKMQYMFYSPALCVWPPSPQLLLYCTNSPNTSYAMSRLVNFKLPLRKPFFFSQNVSLICRIHSTQLGSSHSGLLELEPIRGALQD